ncbi:MFS transporter [Aureimonas fodinaquatilis]|uniref:MFS transporter n=1 Tax=Aureimonas fodinaquatilis TaxID=2565783 RepID=A0A5B0DVA0_9HYPH|nr:MFS transporter [Aureimonas fodinaquatilis]KAA0969721.1 MFS transporter [Aureimonas fodinaquatilis]
MAVSGRSGFAHPYIVLACGAGIVTLSMGIRQAFGLYMRPIELELGVSREAFGLAIAVQTLMLGIAQPFIGALADKYGSGRLAMVGGLLYALSLVLAGLAAGAVGINLSLGFLTGLAMTGVTFVVILGAVGRAVPAEKRGMAIGITTAGGSFGQFLLVPITQGLISEFGWRETLFISAAIALLMVPLARGVAGVSESSSFSKSQPQQSLRQALSEAGQHSGFWLLNIGFFVCGFHVSFIATHLPAFLSDQGLDPAIGARALALIGLFNILGSYVFGLSADKLRKKYVLSALYFARGAVIVLFLAFPFTPLTATLFASAIGFLWLGTVPLTSGLVGQIFGVKYLATLFGIVFMCHQIGGFLGAWLAGRFFSETGSYDLAWQISIALALVAGVVNLPIADRPVARTQMA